MIEALSRAVMALAVCSFGDHRREWALAMEAEFEAAREQGKPLGFAAGCLVAACRDLPAHATGRFAIAAHILALGVIIPVAALMVTSLLAGFPTSYLGHIGVHDLSEIFGAQRPLLSEGTRFAIPSLALLVVLTAVLNLRMAWLALDHDWDRLAAVEALTAAVTVTLLIFSAVAFADHVAALAQAGLLALVLTATRSLAAWHAQMPSPRSGAPSL
jgi:hypothetical protein